MEQTFGQYLKELRLNKKIGILRFSKMIDVRPYEYYKVERDIEPPFTCHTILGSICNVLGLNNLQYDKLLELMSEDFEKKKRGKGIIIHAIKEDGTSLDVNELIELNKQINSSN